MSLDSDSGLELRVSLFSIINYRDGSIFQHGNSDHKLFFVVLAVVFWSPISNQFFTFQHPKHPLLTWKPGSSSCGPPSILMFPLMYLPWKTKLVLRRWTIYQPSPEPAFALFWKGTRDPVTHGPSLCTLEYYIWPTWFCEVERNQRSWSQTCSNHSSGSNWGLWSCHEAHECIYIIL